jgi:hypothetical protein
LAPLRVMYCQCTCLIRSKADLARVTKVAPRAVRGIHLGVDAARGGYFVYIPEWARLTTFKLNEVTFDEALFPRLRVIVGAYVIADTQVTLPTEAQQQLPPQTRLATSSGIPAAAAPPAPAPPAAAQPISSRLRSAATQLVGVLGHGDSATIPVCICDMDVLAISLDDLQPAPMPAPPRTLAAPARTAEAAEWMAAATTEIKAKMANNTYVLVPRPPARKVIKTRFVLLRKLNDDGTVKRYSARWVACGYSQVPGIDYHQTFTATAKSTSVRLFLGVCAHLDLEMRVIDVVKAFTTSALHEDLYVEQPEGFVEGGVGPDGRSLQVCHLRKALEGLKQSGNVFQSDHVAHLTTACGLTQLQAEPCVFILRKDGEQLLILVWIDDLLIGYSSQALYDGFMATYQQRYNVTSTTLTRYIGIELRRDRTLRTITLTQETYLLKMGAKFLTPSEMATAVSMPVAAPAVILQLHANSAAISEAPEGLPYLSLMATALYAAVMTRPDAIHLSSVLCRYMSRPAKSCYAVLISLARYLYSTRSLGITLGGATRLPPLNTVTPAIDRSLFEQQLGLYTCSDAAWKTEHTYCGHAVIVFNAAVDWACKLLKVIAHSSAEAETAAACFAAKRQTFVLNVLREMHLRIPAGASLLIDNTAAKQLAERMGVSKRTEHYMRWQHHLRHLVTHQHLKLHFVRTHEQPADLLTKMVDSTTFLRGRKLMLNE